MLILNRKPTAYASRGEYHASVQDLSRLYAHAQYWHGTGRFQYDRGGQVVDILTSILKDGGLKPQYDNWDRKRGQIRTISFAPSRMYARLYSGMYMPDCRLVANEFGSRWLWSYYFFGTAKLLAWLEYPLQPHIVDYPAKIAQWAGRLSKRSSSMHDIFLRGTDIPDNYPILIGVRHGVIYPTPGSRFFELHEKRTDQHVSIEHFTHLEVPEERIRETQALLRDYGVDIPLVPLEYGEEYCRNFSFRNLVSNKGLRLKL